MNNNNEKILQVINENHKILMKRINKLEEYNEISDLRNKYIYNELKTLKRLINNGI